MSDNSSNDSNNSIDWATLVEAEAEAEAEAPASSAALEREGMPSASPAKEAVLLEEPIYHVEGKGNMVKNYGKCPHNPCKFGKNCRDTREIPLGAKIKFFNEEERGDLFFLNPKNVKSLCIHCLSGRCNKSIETHGTFWKCRIVGTFYTQELGASAPTPVKKPPVLRASQAANSAPASAENKESKTGVALDGKVDKKEKSDKSNKPPKADRSGDNARKSKKPVNQQKQRKDGDRAEKIKRLTEIQSIATSLINKAEDYDTNSPLSPKQLGSLLEGLRRISEIAAKPQKGSAGSNPTPSKGGVGGGSE